jgi:hypothetical protein
MTSKSTTIINFNLADEKKNYSKIGKLLEIMSREVNLLALSKLISEVREFLKVKFP